MLISPQETASNLRNRVVFGPMPGIAPHELVTTGNSKQQITQSGLCRVGSQTLNLGSHTPQTQAVAGSGLLAWVLG